MIGQRIVNNILGSSPKVDCKSKNNTVIKTLNKGNIQLKIVRLEDEYRVSWFDNGIYSEAKSYYTDDYDDAIATAQDMLRRI